MKMDGDYKSEDSNVPPLVPKMGVNKLPLKGSDKDKKNRKDKTGKKEKIGKKEKEKTKSKTASQEMTSENVDMCNSQRESMTEGNCKFITNDESKISNEQNKSANMDSSYAYGYNTCATSSTNINERNRENSPVHEITDGKNIFINPAVCNVEGIKGVTPFSEAFMIPNMNKIMEPPGYALLNNSHGARGNCPDDIAEGTNISSIISDRYSGGLNWMSSAKIPGDSYKYDECGGVYNGTGSADPSFNRVNGVNSMHNLKSVNSPNKHPQSGWNSCSGSVYEDVSRTSSKVKSSPWKGIAHRSSTNNMDDLRIGEESNNVNSAPMKSGSSKKKTKSINDLENREVAIEPENLFANLKRLNVEEMGKDHHLVREKNPMGSFPYENFPFNDAMSNFMGRGNDHNGKSFSYNCGTSTPVSTTLTPIMTGTNNSSNGNHSRMKNNAGITQPGCIATPLVGDFHLADAMSNNTNYEDYTKMSSSVKSHATSDFKKYMPTPISSNGKGNFYTPFLSNDNHRGMIFNGDDLECASNYMPKENVEEGPDSSGVYMNVGSDSGVIDGKNFKGKNLIKDQILNYAGHAQNANHVQHGSHAVKSNRLSYNQSALNTFNLPHPMEGQDKSIKKKQSEDLKFIKTDHSFLRNGDNLFGGNLGDEVPQLVNKNFEGTNERVEECVQSVKRGYMPTERSICTANNAVSENKNRGEGGDKFDENGHYIDNKNGGDLSRPCANGVNDPFNFESEVHKNCENVVGPYNYDDDMNLNFDDRLHLSYDYDLFNKNEVHLNLKHLNDHFNMKDGDIGNASYLEKRSDFDGNFAKLQKDLDFSVNLSNMSRNMSFLNFEESEEKDWKYEQMNEIYSPKGNGNLGSDGQHTFSGKGAKGSSFHLKHGSSSGGYNLGGDRNFGLSACSSVFPNAIYSEPRIFDEKSSIATAIQSTHQCNDGVKKNVNNNNMLFVNSNNSIINSGNAHLEKVEKCANEESTRGRNNDTINSNIICEENNICNNDHTEMDGNHLGLNHKDHSLEHSTTNLGSNKNLIQSVRMNATCASVSESIPVCSKREDANRGNDVDDEYSSALHSGGEHMGMNPSHGSYSNAMAKGGGDLVGTKFCTVHSCSLSGKGSMNKNVIADSTLEDSAKRGDSNAKSNEESNPNVHISGDGTGESVQGNCGKNFNKGNSNKNIAKEVGMVENSQPRENETDPKSISKINTNDHGISINSIENVQLKNVSNFSNESTNSTNSNLGLGRGGGKGSRNSSKNSNSGSSQTSGTRRNGPMNSIGGNENSTNHVKREMNKNDYQNNGVVNTEYRKNFILPQYNSVPLNYENMKNDNYWLKNEMVKNDKSKSSALLNCGSTNLTSTNSNGRTNKVFMNSIFNVNGKDKSHVRKYFQSWLNDRNRNFSNSKYDKNNLMGSRNSLDSYGRGSNLSSANAMNLDRTFLNPSNCRNRVHRASNEKKESFQRTTKNRIDNARRINLLTAEKGKKYMGSSPLFSFNKQNVTSGGYPVRDDNIGAIKGSMSRKAKDDMFHLNGKVGNFGANNKSGMYHRRMDAGESVHSYMNDQNAYSDVKKVQNRIYKNGTNVEENLVDQMNDPNGRCFYGRIRNLHGDSKMSSVNLIGKNDNMFRNFEDDIYKVNHMQEGELKYGPLGGALRNGSSIGVSPMNFSKKNANMCDNLVESDHLNNLTESMSRFENDVDFILDENEDLEGHSKGTMKNDKITEPQNIINSLRFKNKQLEKELTEVKNMQLKKKQNLILSSLCNRSDDISSYSTFKDDTNNSDCASVDNSNRYVQNILNDKEKYNYDTKISIQKFHLAYTNNSMGKLKIAAQRDISGSFMGPKGIHVKTIKSSLHISVYKSAKDVWFPGFADSHVFLLKGNIFGILRACQLLYHYVKSKMSSSKCCIYLVAPFECVQKLLADGCKRMAIIKEECGADVRLGNLYVQVHEGFTERLMEIRGNEVNVDCALEKLVIFMQSCFSVQSYDYELLKYPCRSVLNLQ
ncbi:conserved Plasmodium protein, unknown function [Plasmodium knowlesi strain H]|uniref:Uncharacterized protein n=1 Tax=Plasmodium knowlesi (strain H) TaxID=5851 RepID=A0A1A7VRT1_PLAKH|nr:conserved Plasmodium protein, unknown function [Plasmodium knowlesi strain H]